MKPTRKSDQTAIMTRQPDTEKDAYSIVQEACDTFRAKKDALYDRYRELLDGDIREMSYLSDNPFNPESIERAAKDSGSPVDGKRIAAIAHAFDMSAFCDDDFAVGCMEAIRKAYGEVAEDEVLEKQLKEARAERDRVVDEANRRVREAEDKLKQHRGKISDGIVRPILEADVYRIDNITHASHITIGSRNIGVNYGPYVPVKSQLDSLYNKLKADRVLMSNRQTDPQAHIRNLSGNYVPGVSKDVTIAAASPTGEIYSSGGGNGKFARLKGLFKR